MERKLIGIIKTLVILIVTVLLLGIAGVVSNATIIRFGTISTIDGFTHEGISSLLPEKQRRDDGFYISCAEHIDQKGSKYQSLFCNQHGVRLTSNVNKEIDGSTGYQLGKLNMNLLGETTETDNGEPLHLFKAIVDRKAFENKNIHLTMEMPREPADNIIARSDAKDAELKRLIGTVKTISYGHYTSCVEKIATPAEAYILTEAKNNTDYHSYVQSAWWEVTKHDPLIENPPNPLYNQNVESDGNLYYMPPEDKIAGSGLYKEAKEFAQYIFDISGETNPGLNDAGVFNIDYASKVGAMDTSNINILYDGDTNTYKIGPIKFNYIRRGTKIAGRSAVDFCGISKASLKYNDERGETHSLNLNEGYRIIYNHERNMESYDVNNKDEHVEGTNFYYPYPYGDEEFYLEIDYKEDIVSIEEFAFNLHWMNAGAKYEDLGKGCSYIATWEGAYSLGWGDLPYFGENSDPTKYTLNYTGYAKVASVETIESQPLINCTYSTKVDNIDIVDSYPGEIIDRYPISGQWYEIDTKDPHTIAGGWNEEIVNINGEYGKGGVQVCAGGWELTTELAGFAWAEGIEYEKGTAIRNNDNKFISSTDKKLEKIEVKIYKVVYNKVGNTYVEDSREPADAYAKKRYRNDGTILLEDKYNYRDKKIYTNNNGKYKVFLRIPSIERKAENQKVSYDVEFIYNGQKYETVEYLYSTNKDNITDKVEVYKNIAENVKNTNDDGIISYSRYKNDSFALESPKERKDFDNNFLEIYGDDESTIDNNKKTKGKVKSNEGDDKEITYKGKMYSELLEERDDSVQGVNDSNDRIVSELSMENGEGDVYAKYKMKARTSVGSFLIHYADRIYIRHYKGCVITNNLNKFYKYEVEGADTVYYYPIYEYFHQINIGLMEREGIDISVSKDLYKAQVVVNQQELTYKYNTLRDYENTDNGEYLNILLEIQKINQKYSLGLYPSDFYYRSSVYKSNTDIGQKIKNWKDGSELRMFATYKMVIYNDSDTFDVTINKFSDYYDSNFTLVKKNITENVIDSEGKKYSKVVAEQPYYRIYSLLESNLSGKLYNYNSKEDLNVSGLSRSSKNDRDVVNEKIPEDSWTTENSSSNLYKRASLTNFKYRLNNRREKVRESDVILSPGERIELFVTYEIDNAGYETAKGEENFKNATKRNKLLGGKNNVIEVDNYSNFYTEESIRTNTVSYEPGQIAGRIDDDSAPGNINLSKMITDEDGDKTLNKKWFEDDTESAPVYRIYLRENEEEQRQINGKVWVDKKEKEIKNSSNEVLDTATGNGILNSNEEGINGITVSLVEKIRIKDDSSGDVLEYDFIWPENITCMNGYDSITETSGSGNQKGTYKFKNFPSGIYVVRFEYGNTEKTLEYNGQDYENTAYQIDRKNASEYTSSLIENCDTLYQKGESTLNNEWHDIGDNETAKALENDRISDARDYEPQRLRVIAYSRTISNSNGEVLAKGESNKEELINATAMVANTAKINFEIERQSEIDYTNYNRETDRIRGEKIKLVTGVSKKQIEGTEGVNTTTQKYEVKNIDFGIEKRAQTSIQLDKQLKKIVLSKENSSDVILEANITDNEEIEFTDNGLNTSKILGLTQSDGVQGFKYITMESNYFNDLTVLLTYRIDVVNESEVDWTSDTLSDIYNVDELNKLADNLEGNYTTNKTKHTAIVKGEGISYGKYAGYYYYTNSSIDGTQKIETKPSVDNPEIIYKDKVVKTTVDQIVDYIDKDTSLASTSKTLDKDNSWRDNLNDGYTEGKVNTLNGLVSDDSYSIVDGKLYLTDELGNLFISKTKSNIAISTSDVIEEGTRKLIKYGTRKVNRNGERVKEDASSIPTTKIYRYKNGNGYSKNIHNPELTKELIPVSYEKHGAERVGKGATGTINITTSVSTNQSNSKDDMNYNNLAEVLVYSNTVGRRTFMNNSKTQEEHKTINNQDTISTIPGNALEILKTSGYWEAGHGSNASKNNVAKLAEIDADATEFVTFTEPTGISYLNREINKYIIVVLIVMITIVFLMFALTAWTVRYKKKNQL